MKKRLLICQWDTLYGYDLTRKKAFKCCVDNVEYDTKACIQHFTIERFIPEESENYYFTLKCNVLLDENKSIAEYDNKEYPVKIRRMHENFILFYSNNALHEYIYKNQSK